MSRENVDLIRRMSQMFNDGDVEAIVAEVHPNVKWEEQFIPGVDPVYHGRDGVRRWGKEIFSARGEEWVSQVAEIEGIEEVAGAVIAATRIEAEGRDGIKVKMRVHQVFTFRNGMIVRRQVFQTSNEALEAVGLSE